MTIDLSRSIELSFREAVARADGLRQAGRGAEAASVYREASRLSGQLAQHALSTPEKARRQQRARDLERLAEQMLNASKCATPPGIESANHETDELQAQIDALVTAADVDWGDVGGLDGTKRQLQVAFGIAVARKPAGVAIEPVRNVLLYGPPGTGKSLLAAAASRGLGATFFNVSAARVLSKWFGESSRLIAVLFATARRRTPAVVFIDELESLFPSRDDATSGPERRVLSTLLAELSGLATSGSSPTVLTIGATNAPWLMDAAALSRFGRRIYVPLPDEASRHAILEIHFTRRGHTLDFPLDRLVAVTAGLSGRQLSHLASAIVERMVSDCNPQLPALVARGPQAVQQYELKTRPLRWPDIEPILSGIRPDTTPEAIHRFATWST